MRIFLKSLNDVKANCWIEEWSDAKGDWEVVCEALIIVAGDELMVDHIETAVGHRRKGYATAIIDKLKSTGKKVTPIGILPFANAQGFWKAMGMTDGLGEET